MDARRKKEIKWRRLFYVALNLVLTLLARELPWFFLANWGNDPVKCVIEEMFQPGGNDNYPNTHMTIMVPTVMYIYELFFDLQWTLHDLPTIIHHLVSLGCVVCFKLNTSGLLFCSAAFFLADLSALPLFAFDWKGKMLQTAAVATNYTAWRIPFTFVLVRAWLSATEHNVRQKMPYLEIIRWMVLLIVLYAFVPAYKLWKPVLPPLWDSFVSAFRLWVPVVPSAWMVLLSALFAFVPAFKIWKLALPLVLYSFFSAFKRKPVLQSNRAAKPDWRRRTLQTQQSVR